MICRQFTFTLEFRVRDVTVSFWEGIYKGKRKVICLFTNQSEMHIREVRYWSLTCIHVSPPFSRIVLTQILLWSWFLLSPKMSLPPYAFVLTSSRKAQLSIWASSVEINDCINRGFLLMLRLSTMTWISSCIDYILNHDFFINHTNYSPAAAWYIPKSHIIKLLPSFAFTVCVVAPPMNQGDHINLTLIWI